MFRVHDFFPYLHLPIAFIQYYKCYTKYENRKITMKMCHLSALTTLFIWTLMEQIFETTADAPPHNHKTRLYAYLNSLDEVRTSLHNTMTFTSPMISSIKWKHQFHPKTHDTCKSTWRLLATFPNVNKKRAMNGRGDSCIVFQSLIFSHFILPKFSHHDHWRK